MRTLAERFYDFFDGIGVDPIAVMAVLCIGMSIIYSVSMKDWDSESLTHKIRVVCAYVTTVILTVTAYVRLLGHLF